MTKPARFLILWIGTCAMALSMLAAMTMTQGATTQMCPEQIAASREARPGFIALVGGNNPACIRIRLR